MARDPEAIGLDAMCPRCEARPGEPCVTVSGKKSARLHTPRTAPVYEAWRTGWNEAWPAGWEAGHRA